MSVSGMKKQLHKASQLLNERLMGAEGTKMDDDFLKMEKTVTVIHSLLVELLSRTTEFLQPNPAHRARLSMLHTVSRIRGQGRGRGRAVSYPQTESMLGDCMLHHGRQLGAASAFGGALSAAGEALQQVAEARDVLDVSVQHGFIQPLQDVHSTELKQIRHQLRKVTGRRLDFDYKRSRGFPSEEVRLGWEKLSTSKELAERSMFGLLHNDVDQLGHLSALIAALLDFHRNAHRALLGLHGNLQARLTAASNRPERRFRPKKIRITRDHNGSIGFYRQTTTRTTSRTTTQLCSADRTLVPEPGPCCRALYSFHPDREGELDFSEGDVITLTNQVDANWYEGTLGSQSGLFPVCYVDVLVPLPSP